MEGHLAATVARSCQGRDPTTDPDGNLPRCRQVNKHRNTVELLVNPGGCQCGAEGFQTGEGGLERGETRANRTRSVPEVPPISMALRLRALMMFTVMVLAVGL